MLGFDGKARARIQPMACCKLQEMNANIWQIEDAVMANRIT